MVRRAPEGIGFRRWLEAFEVSMNTTDITGIIPTQGIRSVTLLQVFSWHPMKEAAVDRPFLRNNSRAAGMPEGEEGKKVRLLSHPIALRLAPMAPIYFVPVGGRRREQSVQQKPLSSTTLDDNDNHLFVATWVNVLIGGTRGIRHLPLQLVSIAYPRPPRPVRPPSPSSLPLSHCHPCQPTSYLTIAVKPLGWKPAPTH